MNNTIDAKSQEIIDAIEFILIEKEINYNIFVFSEINLVLPKKYSCDLELLEEIFITTKTKIKITFDYGRQK